MFSAIILLLALLTAGLVIGVFAMALIELNQIDEIAHGEYPSTENLPKVTSSALPPA